MLTISDKVARTKLGQEIRPLLARNQFSAALDKIESSSGSEKELCLRFVFDRLIKQIGPGQMRDRHLKRVWKLAVSMFLGDLLPKVVLEIANERDQAELAECLRPAFDSGSSVEDLEF